MRKTTILIIILLALGVGIFIFSNKSQKITNYPSDGKTIVVLGDSLVQGVGATKDNDFPAVLSKLINEPIINMGVSGNTTGDGLARVKEVIAEDPKIVLLLLGGNDYLRKISIEKTFKNIDQIILTLQREGAVVVLLGVQGGILGDKYEKYFEELSEKRGTLYVPNVLDGIIGRPNLMSDAIHPNDLGYQKIAEKIYPILNTVLR